MQAKTREAVAGAVAGKESEVLWTQAEVAVLCMDDAISNFVHAVGVACREMTPLCVGIRYGMIRTAVTAAMK